VSFAFLQGGEAGEVQQMIGDCQNVRNVARCRGGPGFSEWELEFLDSIDEQFGRRGWLSEKQIERLRQMWNRI
jgi:hypothetical protein